MADGGGSAGASEDHQQVGTDRDGVDVEPLAIAGLESCYREVAPLTSRSTDPILGLGGKAAQVGRDTASHAHPPTQSDSSEEGWSRR